jgi:hypothetical protein
MAEGPRVGERTEEEVSTMQHPPGVWTVLVWWTSSRPIQPDEHVSAVLVLADDEVEASLASAQMVAVQGAPDGGRSATSGRPSCVMPTRTEVVSAIF